MLDFLSSLGLGVFAVAFGLDFYKEWLSPRLLSRSWFPGEPDLPPVAGEVEETKSRDVDRVVLATYLTAVAFLFIGIIDASPVNPECLPYSGFINQYLVRMFGATTALMWYSEGKGIVISHHSEIRYTVGLLTLALPLYSKACGAGIL